MKNKTSLINKTALRKDILRYAPIWALYTILLMLVLFSMSEYSPATMARDVVDFLKGMAWLNLFYGGICGVFLFMDLFNGRLCNALHAFPMRREGWLATHILAGVLFSLVPNLLATGIASLMLWEYAYMALIWLAISTLQYLFFFGTAVLAATCAGNLLGTVAIYGITHFVTLFIYGVAQVLYQPLLYGVRLNGNAFLRYFPLAQMGGFDYAHVDVYHQTEIPRMVYNGLEGEAWLYVGICAAVGILCLFLAWLVYRRRNLEAAGDFISLKPLAPLFILVCTVGAGLFLYLFSDLVENTTYLFLVLGMIIGYFAGKMLLNRTLKVFSKKSILTLGAVLLVFAGSLGLTWLDPLGITTYVPKAENIEVAHIYGADKRNYLVYSSPFTSYVGDEYEDGYDIVDAQEVAQLQDFHRQLTQYRPTDNEGVLCDVQISYKLKNGRTVVRYYEVGRDTPLGQKAGEYFNDMRYIFEVNDTNVLYDAFETVYIYGYKYDKNIDFKLTDKQDVLDLLNAIAADCQAGTMAQNWAYHKENGDVEYNLEFSLSIPDIHEYGLSQNRFFVQVYPDSYNTVTCLQAKAAANENISAE